MGLLDSVLGQVLGGIQQQQQPQGGLAEVLGGLLADNGAHGGLGGLISRFEQAGMGDVVGSWIGRGSNMPISGGQLQDVLGPEVIQGIAQKLGMNASTLLPTLIDHLTPNGQAPAQGLGSHDDLLSSLSGLLQKN